MGTIVMYVKSKTRPSTELRTTRPSFPGRSARMAPSAALVFKMAGDTGFSVGLPAAELEFASYASLNRPPLATASGNTAAVVEGVSVKMSPSSVAHAGSSVLTHVYENVPLPRFPLMELGPEEQDESAKNAIAGALPFQSIVIVSLSSSANKRGQSFVSLQRTCLAP
jgi:hypothetical protein